MALPNLVRLSLYSSLGRSYSALGWGTPHRSSDDVGAVDVDNHLPLHIIIKEKKKLKQKFTEILCLKGSS